MISYKITTGILGAAIFLIILLLVRRGKLQEKYALTWFAIGMVVVVLGIFPVILDKIAKFTGVSYAPALLFVIAVGVLLIQNLYLFIFASQNEVRIKELLQEVAVLNKLVAELREEVTFGAESTGEKRSGKHVGLNGTNDPVSDDQEPGLPANISS
ncbi:MAG: DUF2304 domain-containing protein [Deltaproteobacteria bacterium]|jgi:hypothetical protein|nr:DUF2304 domain-containing protein [Deltaproteobacteria bacterium]